ncbi:MAG TPA: DUF1145 domain-containing protein [Pseudomonadales bacterium]
MIVSGKIVTLAGWLLILANLAYPLGNYQQMINWAGIGLLAAHVIEMLVFLPKARRVGGPLAGHLLQLLVFGYVHNMVMEQALAARHTTQ